MDKQSRTRLDATECPVWSGSALFAYRVYFENLKEIVSYYFKTLRFETDLSNWYGLEIQLDIQ